MPSGPVMLDLPEVELTPEDRDLLKHPSVDGVILFSRNYASPEQLERLVAEIHGVREPSLLVAVDQEGGRVQRFRDGFTRLPPVRYLGKLHDQQPKLARELARLTGWVMAAELRAVGVDLSFAPVLDLDRGMSGVIGDRAFHRSPDVVAELAHAYMSGMHEAGMAATGKHFPGHGGVRADSHEELPVDERTLEDLLGEDLVPFERLVRYGMAAVMPAHVVYSQMNSWPAGFSRFWLQDVLRGRLAFQGVIFSDDLNMAAADAGGDHSDRAKRALEAGCDMVIICNNRPAAITVVEALSGQEDPVSGIRRARMHGRGHLSWVALHEDRRWRDAVEQIEKYAQGESLELDF